MGRNFFVRSARSRRTNPPCLDFNFEQDLITKESKNCSNLPPQNNPKSTQKLKLRVTQIFPGHGALVQGLSWCAKGTHKVSGGSNWSGYFYPKLAAIPLPKILYNCGCPALPSGLLPPRSTVSATSEGHEVDLPVAVSIPNRCCVCADRNSSSLPCWESPVNASVRRASAEPAGGVT